MAGTALNGPAVHRRLNLPFWISFAIVIVGLLLNGWIAALEDHWQVRHSIALSGHMNGSRDEKGLLSESVMVVEAR